MAPLMLPTFFLRPSQQAPVPSLKIAPFTPSQATKNFALLWFSLLKALALSFVNAGPQSATGQAHASRGERLGQQEGESLHGARWVGSFTGRVNLMPWEDMLWQLLFLNCTGHTRAPLGSLG